MPASLDELRHHFPGLGFAVYAYEPGGAVTLEIHDGEDVYSFPAATEAEAVALAFPMAPADDEPGEQPAPTTNHSVFD